MTATLFQDPLAQPTITTASASDGQAAQRPSFMAPAPSGSQDTKEIRRAQRDHAEIAKAQIAADLAAALSGKRPLRSR